MNHFYRAAEDVSKKSQPAELAVAPSLTPAQQWRLRTRRAAGVYVNDDEMQS